MKNLSQHLSTMTSPLGRLTILASTWREEWGYPLREMLGEEKKINVLKVVHFVRDGSL